MPVMYLVTSFLASLSLSCHKPDIWLPKCQGAFLPCNAHLFSFFKHTHMKELVFTRDFIFGRNFPSLILGKSLDKLFRQRGESLP